MNEESNASGAQFRADRPIEQEAVRTTIVGGRPPGSGQPLGAVPRGLEVLVKKAAVDPEFRRLLLAERTEAARQIGLELDPSEVLMLQAVPEEQLSAIIDRTVVPEEHRRAFLGQAAAAMLAVLGLGSSLAVAKMMPAPGGSAPWRPGEIPPQMGGGGVRVDRPKPTPKPDDLKLKVIGLIADQWKIKKETITLGQELVKDLKADDKKLAELKVALEKAFDVKLREEPWKGVRTVGGVVDRVRAAVKSGNVAPPPPPSRGIQPDRPPPKA